MIALPVSPPNPRLRRTPSASPSSPLSRQPLGRRRYTAPFRTALILGFAHMLVLGASWVAAVEPPPDGLHWQELKEIRGRILVPDGWSFSRIASAQPSYLVVPPRGKAVFTLMVERHDPTRVESEARQFVNTQAKLATSATPIEEFSMGVMKGFGSLLDIQRSRNISTWSRKAVTAIANVRTGTYYVMRFDVPVEEWDSVWERGRFLVGKFTLEEEE